MIQFRVTALKDLKVIIDRPPALDKYPLISQKWADYFLFKQAFLLISRKEHLTKEGLHKLVAIKASINKGLSDELKAGFPDIIPVSRPELVDQVIKDPHWLAGFTSGEGCFLVNISKSSINKSGAQVQLCFIITQHSPSPQPVSERSYPSLPSEAAPYTCICASSYWGKPMAYLNMMNRVRF